jgi:hypothetical protein
VAAAGEDFSMGKGRFVNQKLGKNISRKFGLLKSELSVSPARKSSPRSMNQSLPQKGTLPAKP